MIPIQIARFMGPTWGPTGSCRPQMGPMLAPWTLLSGYNFVWIQLFMHSQISILAYPISARNRRTVTQWRHMTTENWVNIGSGKRLLPDGTEPLPDPLLTYYQLGPLTFIWEKCNMSQPSINTFCFKITYPKFHWNFPGTNELMSLIDM